MSNFTSYLVNQAIVRTIVRRLLRDMQSAGYAMLLQCPMTGALMETTEGMALNTMEKSGRGILVFTKPGKESEWVTVIPIKKWGCLNDATVGMSEVMKPIREWIAKARV